MTRVFLSQSVSEELNIKLKRDWFVEKSAGSVFVSFKTLKVFIVYLYYLCGKIWLFMWWKLLRIVELVLDYTWLQSISVPNPNWTILFVQAGV